MTEASSAPAGWYPQPDGSQRWWDGAAWTEHIAPAPAPAPIEAVGDRANHREVEPTATTSAPAGGIVAFGGLAAGEIGWFGDDDLKLAVDSRGMPAVAHPGERAISRWVAEHSSPGMFELVGTWFVSDGLEQGVLATGASENWLLLTDSHLRGSIPSRDAEVRAGNGTVPAGHVYAFAIPLVDIALIDGNKNDIAIADDIEGVLAKWVVNCDADWSKVGSSNPWHRDNATFALDVLNACITAKSAHADEKVRASALDARSVDTSRAFATRRRTTFEFVTP